MSADIERRELRSGKVVEGTVHGLYRNREIVLGPECADIFLPIRCGDRNRLLLGRQGLHRIENDLTEAVRTRIGIRIGKIGGDEPAALALCHVTLRALRFSKEKLFPVLGITGQRNCAILTLQSAKVSDDREYLVLTEPVE